MYKPGLFIISILLYSVIAQKKSSLTFVIDDTNSMYDDIDAVKSAANAIFDTVMSSNSSQIEDFVLVTFNDPGTKHWITTKSREDFKKALNNIRVYGGGDCPEMAMSGIKLGLENSRVGSLLYVFTDASALDPGVYHEVKKMAVPKQCQIVFALTGECRDGNSEVYDKVAASTNGQVFHLDRKNELSKILNYVRTQINNRKAVLARTEFPSGEHSLPLEVDSTMKELIISVAGKDPSITVRDPLGAIKDTVDVARTRNVAIVKVEEITAGKYTATISSTTKTTVVVTAATTVHFQHGFSPFEPSSLDETTVQPIPGETSYISIKLDIEGDGDVKLNTVQFLDMDNNIVSEHKLVLKNGKHKFYTSKNIVSTPNKRFRIAIKGQDPRSGEEITRISLTPLEPQFKEITIPETPPVVMVIGESKIVAVSEKSLQLKCAVKGYPKPDVIWETDDKTELKAELRLVKLPSDYISIVNVDRVLHNLTYICRGINKLGEDYKRITVQINEYFNIVRTPKSADIMYGEEAKFECLINAIPPAAIKWYRNDRILLTDDNIEISNDGSALTIKKMQPKHAGKYICVAENKNNRQGFRFKVHIIGVEFPLIDKSTSVVRVKDGAQVNISCRIVKGRPKPAIFWYFKQESADFESRLEENDDKEVVLIEKVTQEYVGTYRCEAHSEIGYDYHNIEVFAGYPPTIKGAKENILAIEDKTTTLPCEVDAKPAPFIKWFLNGTEISLSRRFVRKERSGTILFKPKLSDVGTYVCEAENEYGTAKKVVDLSVVVPPNMEAPKKTKFKTKLGDDLELTCSADGYPRPDIEWRFHSFDKKASWYRLRAHRGSTLKLRRIQMHRQGYYTCIASNLGGSSNITYTVAVLAPPSIEIENPNVPYVGVEGDLVLRIPCKASGNPPPDVTWSKGGVGVPSGSEWYDIEKDGTLVIKNLDKKSAGAYICQAKNELGVDLKPVDVICEAHPESGPPSSTVSAKEGNPVSLKCDVPHRRTDSIRWYKDEKLLTTEDEQLYFMRVTKSDNGIYTCRVSDFVNSRNGHVKLAVGSKPTFVVSEVEKDIYFEEGTYSDEMDCRAVGYPEPKVTWWHGDVRLPVTSMVYALTMTLKDRGSYVCHVKNEHGRISREFSVESRDCILDVWSEIKERQFGHKIECVKLYFWRQPLTLQAFRNDWPNFRTSEGYIIMPPGEPVRLHCPSGFSHFPDLREVVLECSRGSTFIYEGETVTFANFQCQNSTEVTPKMSGENCLPRDISARSVKVGYNTNRGFVGVYEVCIDSRSRTPVYSKVKLHYSLASREADRRTRHTASFIFSDTASYDCKKEREFDPKLAKWDTREDDCCFKESLLVNSKDVFPGLPQVATYSNLNIVPQWSTCNSKNWDEVEEAVRTLVKSTGEELVVYTGVIPGHSETPVSPFIWKVVLDPTTKKSVAIVQVNVPDVTLAEVPRWQRCRDLCPEIAWLTSSTSTFHDVRQGYTYCCSVLEFERAFSFEGVFDRGDGSVLRDVSFLPERSLT